MSIYNVTKQQLMLSVTAWTLIWIVGLAANFQGYVNSLFWFTGDVVIHPTVIVMDHILIFSPIITIIYLIGWSKNRKYRYEEDGRGTKAVLVLFVILLGLLALRFFSEIAILHFYISMLMLIMTVGFLIYRNAVVR